MIVLIMPKPYTFNTSEIGNSYARKLLQVPTSLPENEQIMEWFFPNKGQPKMKKKEEKFLKYTK